MVARKQPKVKGKAPCDYCGKTHSHSLASMWCWIDAHPRYWWFWTIMLLLNTLLNLLDVAGFGNH